MAEAVNWKVLQSLIEVPASDGSLIDFGADRIF
jgi:hypothetical protein